MKLISKAKLRVLNGVAAASLCLLGASVEAGSVKIGTVTSPTFGGFGGITFDTVVPGKPLIATGTSSNRLERIDPTNAAVLASYSVPEDNGSRGMVFGNGVYYKTAGTPTGLYRVDPLAGTSSLIGTSLNGGSQNFIDTGFDPTTGRLWAVTDRQSGNGGSLYEISLSSGVMTFRRSINLQANMNIVSLAIDAQGRFFVSNYHSGGLENQIFQIDPFGTNVTLVTKTGYFGADFLNDFSYDASTANWYGVVEVRSASPRRWDLVRLTGVPEPTAGLGLACAATLARRRR